MSPFEDLESDPMKVFRDWLAVAELSEPNDPTAAALATVSHLSVPSVRMVLLKGTEDRGLRFFTNRESRKGIDLRDNPEAALCLHWKSLRRQVRFQGRVEELARAEVETYFHSRSRGSQIAAAVSKQSRPLTSRGQLEVSAETYRSQLGESEVLLPNEWTGYMLVPRTIEFWRDGQDRLHDRVRFTREAQCWTSQRLYP
jgi:pyridoxamine 5'-phosphate oxidase